MEVGARARAARQGYPRSGYPSAMRMEPSRPPRVPSKWKPLPGTPRCPMSGIPHPPQGYARSADPSRRPKPDFPHRQMAPNPVEVVRDLWHCSLGRQSGASVLLKVLEHTDRLAVAAPAEWLLRLNSRESAGYTRPVPRDGKSLRAGPIAGVQAPGPQPLNKAQGLRTLTIGGVQCLHPFTPPEPSAPPPSPPR